MRFGLFLSLNIPVRHQHLDLLLHVRDEHEMHIAVGIMDAHHVFPGPLAQGDGYARPFLIDKFALHVEGVSIKG